MWMRQKRPGMMLIKFQSYKAETIVSKNSPAYWVPPKKRLKHSMSCSESMTILARWNIAVCVSTVGLAGLPFFLPHLITPRPIIWKIWLTSYKISSSDLSNLPFVRHIARKGKPIYLSVGASYLSEVDQAVRAMKEEGCPEIALLHCVLSYPCKNEDANLNIIQTLRRIFPDLKIGYSDHTMPDETMTILTTAYLLGAEVIEKHFTLDKTLPGNDHYHAGEPADFKKAIGNFRLVNTILGQKEKTVLPCEVVPQQGGKAFPGPDT